MPLHTQILSAYRHKINTHTVFLYVLTVLMIIEVYFLGVRENYNAIALMLLSAFATVQFTRNMIVILLASLVFPAIYIQLVK